MILLLLLLGSLWALKAEYQLSALGLKIAYLSIEKTETPKLITIKTHSLTTNSIFPPLNNEYRISLDEQSRPLSLKRIIRQKKLTDEVSTEYDFTKLVARMTHKTDGSIMVYHIGKTVRDVFSFLSLVSDGKVKEGRYNIDGNGTSWQAKVKEKPDEMLNTAMGKLRAQRYEISFENLSGQKQPYVDMVTHNMLNEGNKMNLWVDDRHIIVKAILKSKGISTHWDLTGVTP